MKHFKFLLFLSFLSSIVSSCAFNTIFLHPTQISSEANLQTMYIQDDTVNVYYSGDYKQPLFVRNGEDTVEFRHSIESVLFLSKSGNLLNGWMLKPKNIEPKATLLFFHGNSGDLASTHWSMTLLLQEGFQVFAVDYSGYGLSEGKAKRKHLLKDGNSAVNYLLSREDVKDTKVIIYGQSLGGHLAAVVATENQEKIDGLVIEGAFSSHKDIGKEFAGFVGKWFVKEMYSAKTSLPNFTKPLLVIHSTEDEIIPFFMGQKLYDVAHEPKEFYEIDGCHICGSRLYAKEIADKIFKLVKD